MSATTPGAARPAAPVRRPWVAPLVATLVTLPLGGLTYLIAMVSAFACDACTSQEGHRFYSAFNTAFWVLRCGLFLAFGLLLTAWMLPEPCRDVDVRALVAFAAPVTVLLSLLGFACILATAS
jgi:hypothetical protein